MKNVSLILCCGVFLSSCGVVSYLQDGPLPAARVQADTGPVVPAHFVSGQSARLSGGYGRYFDTVDLPDFIQESLQNNPDYLILRRRVDREYLRIADTRHSNDFSLSAKLSDVENRGPVDSSTYALTLDLAPGIDLWGGTAAQIRAGVLGAHASLFDLVEAERGLQKSIVLAWADLLTARLVVQQRESRLQAYSTILDATRNEVRAGQRAAIDLQLAEIDTIGARDQLESQRQALAMAESKLNRLLGRPAAGHIRLRAGVLPRFPGAAPAGLPSELLTRRADIQAAWARVMATDASFRAARLAMLPSFRLTGSLGNTTSDFTTLLNADRFVASLVASLSASLFDSGASERQVALAMANIEVELQSYAATVMDAMVQVHDLLLTEQSLKRQISLQKQSAALARDAFTQVLDAMRGGNASLYDVSSAALRLYNSEDQIITLRNKILRNRLDLYVALGDDFFDGAEN